MKASLKRTLTNIFPLSKAAIVLLAIILIGAYFRFWNFPNLYGFDPDATRDAMIAYEGARNLYFPTAGAFSSTGPYTFGPWYYISIILFALIFPYPYAPWILMGLGSIITILVMYDIGRLVSSKTLGLILALLTTLAPSEIIAGTSLSNIYPVALFSALSLWAAVRILKSPKPQFYWYGFLGIFLGLSINAHYQSAGLLIMPLIVWFLSNKKNYKGILAFALGVFITFIPLLIFNFTNNWHTLNGVMEMYKSRDRIYVANSWTIYVFQFWPSLIGFIFGTPWIINILLLVTLPFLMGWYMLKKSISRPILIPLVVILTNFISLRYYWGERTWAYHYFLEPLLIFMVGYTIYKLLLIKPLGKLYFVLALTPIIISMGIQDVNKQIAITKNPDSTPKEVRTLVEAFPNKRIEVYKCSEDRSPKAEAFAYLLQFENLPEDGPIQKVGIQTGACPYPNTDTYSLISGSNSDVKNKVYPNVKGTPVADFSAASKSELKNASWSATTTDSVYQKSARWY